jgi:hypothetical protein
MSIESRPCEKWKCIKPFFLPSSTFVLFVSWGRDECSKRRDYTKRGGIKNNSKPKKKKAPRYLSHSHIRRRWLRRKEHPCSHGNLNLFFFSLWFLGWIAWFSFAATCTVWLPWWCCAACLCLSPPSSPHHPAQPSQHSCKGSLLLVVIPRLKRVGNKKEKYIYKKRQWKRLDYSPISLLLYGYRVRGHPAIIITILS